MNKETQFQVGQAENGRPLLQFLAERLAISRRRAKEIIDQRRVFVNGRRTWMARHRLQARDIITGLLALEPPADERRIPVIYEDGDYLVVAKPAGMEANGRNSVEETLNQRRSGQTLAACHRLDKDTSGCLLFAKYAAAKERIIPLFARNQIGKFYQTIVAGRLEKKSLTITRPLEGQRALTHVRLLDSNPSASHLTVLIETGRTHQIRKHLAAIGHPVLGDQQYGGNIAVPEFERSIPRQMLHAAEISFVSPITAKLVRGRAELPDDFKDCLKRYRLK